MRTDPTLANQILYGRRELVHQAEASRDPARAVVKSIGQLLQAEPEAPLQLGKQPPLLDRCARLG
jgi:hypothetical protein